MYSVYYLTIIITEHAHHHQSVSVTVDLDPQIYVHIVEYVRKYVTTYHAANFCVFIFFIYKLTLIVIILL